MASECFHAGVKAGGLRVLMFARQAASLVDSVLRSIEAEREPVTLDAALRQIKALREALDDADRVLEGL